MRPFCRCTYLFCLAILLGACASRNDSPPLPDFRRVALVAASDAREDLKADSTAGMAAGGVAGGAAGGAATGAAVGLLCGPLAFFCVPVGMVAGGVTGGAAGGITQGGKGLSKEHSRQANLVLEQLQVNLDINEKLYLLVKNSLPEEVSADVADADALVTVKVRLIELRQHSDERVSMRIIAEMQSQWDRQLPSASDQTNVYEFETAREYVEDWLSAGGRGFALGLEQCIERVASGMARDLGYPHQL